jgi:uncharacterized Fe-S cluster protein YjdI
MPKVERTYSVDGLTVLWAPTACVRCHNCTVALPAVFDPDRRPWVDLTQATAQEIRAAVLDCPSGALSLGGE